MLLRVPTWCLPILLSTLLTASGPGRATLVLAGSLRSYNVAPRDDSDDSDSDSDDDDKSSTHHHGTSTSAASGRTSVGSGSSATITASASESTITASSSGNKITSHGAVAGIVIACLLFILLLIYFTCWYRRRRRTRQQQAQAAAMAAATPEMKEHTHSSTPLLVQQHPPNPRPRSMTATDSDTVPGPLYFADSPRRRETQAMHNAAPSTDTDDGRSLLPNPYDGETPPQPPPRDLLASPTSPTGPTAWSYSTPTQDASTSASSRASRRVSAAPSAWTHDELHSDAASASSTAPLLARGDTQTSRLTTSSSLHEEMTGYQKRLEAHHRKESEDAVMREHGIGTGANVPADPPPVYSAAVDM
ncbi:hypothetical protein GSI_03927 [Ganoderma sinense ZZ0214-1]|uniref:Transporter n=1 Tax=Ganoderma sinense ZZ0214-1 TaxID=1077348 RepID=A0A2G8SKC4_9APHY|nr:hypothetical protein GSI_03927 [Ganoderma sinense ZZ0214-1]